jgi:hypothetical protein
VDATIEYHSTSTGAVLANDKLLSALQENRLDADPNGRAVHTMLSLGKQMPSYITPNYVTPMQDLMTRRSSICCTRSVGITQLLVVKTSIGCTLPKETRQSSTPNIMRSYFLHVPHDEANGLKNGPTEATTLRHSTHRINEKSTSLKVTLSMKPSSPSSTSQARPA